MADITVTAANVALGSGAQVTNGTAGATITAGQLVYLDSTDNEFKLVDNDSATTDEVAGIALHSSLNAQPLRIQTAGTINLGATLVVGTIYCSSSTGGGIAPAADLASGDFTSVVGVAVTTANLLMGRINGGAVIA